MSNVYYDNFAYPHVNELYIVWTLVDENVNVMFILYAEVDDGFNIFVILNVTIDGYIEFLYDVTGVRQSTLLDTTL